MTGDVHPGLAKAGQPPSTGTHLYSTPPSATRALLRTIDFARCSPIWEPAAGEGAIANVLREDGFVNVIEGDTVYWPTRTGGDKWFSIQDFLKTDVPPAAQMITNPPFDLLTDFMEHALWLGNAGLMTWAFLIPLPALAGRRRLHKVFHNHPPSDVVVLAQRVRFRRYGYEGKLSPMATHCWAVWGGDYHTEGEPTRLHWADNRPGPGE